MTTLYKLTDQSGCTRGPTQWGPGVSHSGTGDGDLCGPGWIHAYTHPLLAVLLNPIHAALPDPRLWEADGEIALDDSGLKVGCRTLTTLREIPLPQITTTQRVRFGILCAMEVCQDDSWRAWADRWLSGEDRSVSAAAAYAADAARAALYAVSAAAAYAADAARAALYAASAASAAAACTNPLNLITLAERAVREEQ